MSNSIDDRKSNRQRQKKINVMNLSCTRIGIRYDFVKISKKFDLDVITKTICLSDTILSKKEINDVIFDEDDFEDFCIRRVEISKSIFYIDV